MVKRNKAEIRHNFKLKRLSLDIEQVRKYSKSITDKFFKHFELSGIETIHVYIPIPGKNEVDTTPILEKMRKDFPKIQTVHPLHNTYQCTSKNNMYINMIIAPLICFDKNGNRLGFGGGFYDRLIKSAKEMNPKCLTIGLAYELSLYKDKLPAELHDQKLDYVITEKKVYKFS